MNFDRLTALLVRCAALARRLAPWPVGVLSALRATWTRKGYFATTGQLRSMAYGRPVDRDGAPLPLLTYGMIDLLVERLEPSIRVFEYGSGSSTRFFAQRVNSVISVEHDPAWVTTVRSAAGPNAQVMHVPADTDGAYSRSIDQIDGEFDLVLVDGRDRVNCALRASDRLSARGVIIIDDTDRPRYQPAITALVDQGFRRLDLRGLRPTGVRNTGTTLLYRPGNCLGI